MPYERTSIFLTANLGSEITRLTDALEKGDQSLLSGAYGRASKIIDELETFPEMKPRKEEISILRGVLEDMTLGKSAVTPQFLKDYFTPFATRLISGG